MRLYTRLLSSSDCYKAGRTMAPKGVMVHSTGANNPNLRRYIQPDDGRIGSNANGNHWNKSGVDTCVHAFIGKLADGTVASYQTLPWTCRGWHAGGAANNTHIAFEICEDGLTDEAYFDQVYQEAVELTAYLCRMFSLDPMAAGVVICHSEGHARGIASNHGDVMHWFPRHGKDMDQFRADVSRILEEKNEEDEGDMTYEKWKEYMEQYRAELAAKPVSDWARDSLEAMVALGVTDGKRPGDVVSREECATMISRALEAE